MDLGMIGNIASVGGVAASVLVAWHQSSQAKRARREAQAERERAATLEAHLDRQRWQQLRSIGEQIDTIERSGKQEHSATEAALHARLREQFASLLAVIATETKTYTPAVVRHWVQVGRLVRPWQVAEAVSHLGPLATDGDHASEDSKYLTELCRDVRRVAKLEGPKQPTDYVAAYILIAHHWKAELVTLLKPGGQSHYTGAVLLDCLTQDCLDSVTAGSHDAPHQRCWGATQKKSLRERFEHYQSLDFWVMAEASENAQRRIEPFRDLFEPGRDRSGKLLVPKEEAAEMARARFPHLVEPAAKICSQS
jgi:hypothetical protein